MEAREIINPGRISQKHKYFKLPERSYHKKLNFEQSTNYTPDPPILESTEGFCFSESVGIIGYEKVNSNSYIIFIIGAVGVCDSYSGGRADRYIYI
jgi:hypothetical protein